MSPNDFLNSLSRLTDELTPWAQSHFKAHVTDLNNLYQDFSTKVSRFAEAEQCLSIGIMGQVKAGKSTFLNALLFDGKPVLPEAATPKTANLTRISYGDEPLLEVAFYSLDEWQAMTREAGSPGMHQEAKVARELLQMAESRQLDVSGVLAEGERRLGAQSVDELIGMLNDYAGENGRFTPLVKTTRLHLPLEVLKGFTVVDTPGMNDPVLSRTQKTREYMAECDVVFFLSRCSQFLDQSDMDLLDRQLPGKGVKRMVLVAGQADSLLLDNGYDCASLAEAESDLTVRLSRRARDEMEKLADRRERMGSEYAGVAALLRSLRKPVIASTFAHGFVHWPESHWSNSMRHVHREFANLADQQWSGNRVQSADWLRIANFEPLRAAFEEARHDKKEILDRQREEMLPDALREARARLQAFIEAVELHSLELREGDIDALANKMKACEGRIGKISALLKEQIDCSLARAADVRRNMLVELQRGLALAAEVQARTGTETETRSREVSNSTWWKPWTWGTTRMEYYSTVRSYEYLAAADAIEQVVRFGNHNAASMEKEFNRIVDPNQLKLDLSKTLIGALDTGSSDFDPGLFRNTLSSALKAMEIPALSFVLGNSASMISSKFSGEVRGDADMVKLRAALQDSLETVLENLKTSFLSGVDKLQKQLETMKENLESRLTAALHDELTSFRRDFAEKESLIEGDARLIALLQGYHGELKCRCPDTTRQEGTENARLSMQA